MRRLAAIAVLAGCVPERAVVPPPPAGWSSLVVVSLAGRVPLRAVALDPAAPVDLELTLPRDEGALAALGFSARLGELCLPAGPLEVVERGRPLPTPAAVFGFAPGDVGWRAEDDPPPALTQLEIVDPRRDPGFAAARCGDGLVCEGLEECDDGNQVDGDGCSASCRRVCRCGDGLVCGDEACDDGNRDDDDGCTTTCQRRARCGDGVRDRPLEQCDDGNRVDDDECSNDCRSPACRAIGVVAAHWMSFVLAQDGTLYGFGVQAERPIGVAPSGDVPTPAAIPGGPWRSVSAFGRVTAAIARDGTLFTWGAPGSWLGRAHDADSAARPGPVDPTRRFRAVATGFEHVIALDTASVAWSFGENGRGQLGLGDRSPRALPAAIGGPYAGLAAGGATSVLLDASGALFTFGSNDSGTGAADSPLEADDHVAPTRVERLPPIAAVELGYHHGFALDREGGLWAFGGSPYGELGDGTATGTAPRGVHPPRRVGSGRWRWASAGDHHSLGIDERGRLYTWGSNPPPGGQTGLPPEVGGMFTTPIELWNEAEVVDASAGWRHSLFLDAAGRLFSFSLGDPRPAGRGGDLVVPGPVELCR